MGAHKNEEINIGRNTTAGLVLETYKKKHEVKKKHEANSINKKNHTMKK